MRVAVTGGSGFIGQWVVDELCARGHEPVVFDHRGRSNDTHEVMLGDVRHATAVNELAAHVDGIIHLAAVLGTQETVNNPLPAIWTNVVGTANLSAACREHDIPVVNIAVGNWWMLNAYSITKHCASQLLDMHRIEHDLKANQVRVVNAYGPRQRAAKPFAAGKVRKVMPSFICRALSGMPIEVYGDGLQVSDCVWVGDVARVLVKALEHAANGDVFDRPIEVGPDAHRTVLDLANLVANTAADTNEQVHPVDIVYLPMRPGEKPGDTVTADTTTLALVDEHPDRFVPLADGVQRTVEWFAANEDITWSRP